MLPNDVIESLPISIMGYQPVSGGDINSCYHVTTVADAYFLKVNDASVYPGMFEKEADGLAMLRANTPLKVPAVIACGTTSTNQYLLLEWITGGTGTGESAAVFGAGMALLHQCTQPLFGYLSSNYIGSLHQKNQPVATWAVFYAQQRILPLVKIVFDQSAFGKSDLKAADNCCNRLHTLIPVEPPALLHGDLWSGNYKTTTAGDTAIFDPAIYYGHQEMDIAMTRLFGGFSPAFYDGYQQVFPLQQGWEKRLPLMQLYPLLVHAILFGGHYISQCSDILRKWGG